MLARIACSAPERLEVHTERSPHHEKVPIMWRSADRERNQKRHRADVTVWIREETNVLASNSSFDDDSSCWTEIAGDQGGGITRT